MFMIEEVKFKYSLFNQEAKAEKYLPIECGKQVKLRNGKIFKSFFKRRGYKNCDLHII